MKIFLKTVCVICVLALLSGCAQSNSSKAQTVMQKLEQQYDIIKSTSSSAEIRDSLNAINELSNSDDATDDEKKFARILLYYCSGIAKLAMTDKGISAFEFLEVTYLQPYVEGTFENEEFVKLDEALDTSEKFLKHVNEFIK